MALSLKCPVCGLDVVSSQLQLLIAKAMDNHGNAETVVCHCPDNHRFVASLKDANAKASSAS